MNPGRPAALLMGVLLAATATGCTISAVSVSTQERDHELVRRLNVVTFHGDGEGRSLVRLFDGAAEDENTFSLLQLTSWKRENTRPASGQRSSQPGAPGIYFGHSN